MVVVGFSKIMGPGVGQGTVAPAGWLGETAEEEGGL